MSFGTDLGLTYPSSDDVRRMNSELPYKLHANELTVRDLQEAIMAIYEVNGEIRSVGIEFIKYYRSGIKSVVSATQLTELYFDYIDNPAITAVITVHVLFDMLDTNLTDQLVREITSRHAMPDCTWIRTAGVSYGGVSRETIYEAIMAQLDEGRFTLEESRPFAESFLQHGSGSHVVQSRTRVDADEKPYLQLTDTSAIWCAVPADKFYDVVERCICRAPEVMFMPGRSDYPDLQQRLTALRPETNAVHFMPYTTSRTLHLMLSPTDIIRLRHKAVPWLATLKGLSVDMLMELSEDAWLEIAKRALPGSMEFLVRVSLHSYKAQFCFANHFASVEITGEELLRTYRTLYSELHDPKVGERIEAIMIAIDKQLIKLLAEHGYYVGKVSKRPYQGEDQLFFAAMVAGRTVNIIQSGRQARNQRFSMGDTVVVNRHTNNMLDQWLSEGRPRVFGDFEPINREHKI